MEEALNNSTQSAAQNAAPAPAAAPAVAPAPAAQPSYTVTPSSTESSSGGSGSSGGDSVLDTLKNLNWIEILFGAFGAAALFSAITYFRSNKNTVNPTLNDMYNKIDKLTIELSDVKTALETQSLKQNTQSTQGFI
jgi:hypothetical protein